MCRTYVYCFGDTRSRFDYKPKSYITQEFQWETKHNYDLSKKLHGHGTNTQIAVCPMTFYFRAAILAPLATTAKAEGIKGTHAPDMLMMTVQTPYKTITVATMVQP